MAVKEKDNYETVKVTMKVARKDKDGKRVKQIIDRDTKKSFLKHTVIKMEKS